MAHKQHPSRFHGAMDALKHPPLRRRIKINHHIATENNVKGLTKRPPLFNQIHLEEVHRRLKLWFDPHHSGIGTFAAKEKTAQLSEPTMVRVENQLEAGNSFWDSLPSAADDVVFEPAKEAVKQNKG